MVLASFVIGVNLLLQTSAFQLSIPNLPKAPTPDTVVVKVNGVPIKAKDIEDLLWEARGDEILNEIMYYQVAKMEADRMGLIVTGEEVEQGVARELDQIRQTLSPGQTLEAMMAQSGQTRSRLYIAVKTSLYLTKIAFQDFEPKGYVRVSTIVIRPRSASAEDVGNTIQVAQKAYDRIKAGEPWEKLVDELVTDPTGRQNRGLLGWRQIAAFPESSVEEIKGLKKGDITKPVQTQNGIQIFRVEARGDGATKDELAQMQVDLAESLRLQAVQKLRKNLKLEKMYPPKAGGS